MFFERLKFLCDQKGLTPYKACIEIGLNRSIVAKWKKGSIPNGETLSKLAAYFGVSVSYLLGEEEQKETPASEIVDLGDEQLRKAMLGMAELTPERQAIVFALIEELQSAQGK